MKIVFLLSLCCLAFGSIEDHVKKAEGKEGNHSMRGIDFIYMINLDSRPEKFEKTTASFHQCGVYPYRFSAVNGWKELSPEIIHDISLKYRKGMTPLMATTYPMEANGAPSYEFMNEYGKSYLCHHYSRGTLGCSMSHISILKDAWESGYETIWVLEDDVEVLGDLHSISDLIDSLDRLVGKENWDVLFTDQDSRCGVGQYIIASGAAKRPDMDCSIQERYSHKYTLKEDISSDFRKISARFGTYSMIIRRSGIQKLWEFMKNHQIFLPFDLENYLPKGMQRYSLRYDLVTNMLDALTDNAQPGD